MGEKKGIKLPSYETGLSTLDWNVIGCGGIPKGRLIEFFGPESSGKTTLALHIAGCVQRAGGIVVFVDVEHALDINYAAKLGVNIDELIVTQPNTGEEALETVEGLIDTRACDFIIVDSVAALVPRAELEGEMGESHMGLQARLMSQACRKLVPKCNVSGISVLFINQIREKIGVMFGSNETTPGGRALRHYASLRLDVRRRTAIKDGEVLLGHMLEVKGVKNKCGTPLQSTILHLIYEAGIDVLTDQIAYAMLVGVLENKKSWIGFNGKNYRREDLPMAEVLAECEKARNAEV